MFAISTYFTVSLLFWYVGLLPDLATLRDRAKGVLRKRLYDAFALGWRGSNRHWRNYERAYLLLAGLSTPLVLSMHSIVRFDFATSVIPGWHTTIFPPYFVAGAVFSGFAMVSTLMILCRQVYGLKDIITPQHDSPTPPSARQNNAPPESRSIIVRTSGIGGPP
jgi:Ni/Fe-hydrogenase subunit HybB-like protein